MNARSLKLRLLLAAALGIALSLLVAGAAFLFIFLHYAGDLAKRELENDFVQLAAKVRINPGNKIVVDGALSDPRFEKPYSGLYWQIDEPDQEPIRSRSLFDAALPDLTAGRTIELIDGPNQTPLFALVKSLVLPLADGTGRKLSVTMAVDRSEIDDAAQGFRNDLGLGLFILLAALLTGALIQILLGLKPLQDLESAVKDIHGGDAKHLTGKFPSEVEPLVSSLNELLSARDDALERARQRASNMAHGLKTPLTVLGAVADDLSRHGQTQAAMTIRENAEFIHNQVERQLARARMAGGQNIAPTPLRPNVERILRALSKTPEGAKLQWDNTIAADDAVAIEPRDLLELLGNLLDNARKWARTTVRISHDTDLLRIEDDGPGVVPEQMAEIEKRGFKLDNARAGHGLGLAIARELLEGYGLALKYERSSLGGLSVRIVKPGGPAA
ncbi:sensor histidine kinase [Aestuariivirga litoralis]|uniref:sensor histidine kinase n=1 Tax=Aestuariivirga litoralis TaxID=2650924 RepID=UPI0018C782FC|nr:HAMP domain-containing sensor histidine kinase [Aestuariivirga litoralis]MBG1231551.1 HAMP domain-containing histidine kinase [Aestuariivirga litoralis]